MRMTLNFICAVVGSLAISVWPAFAKDRLASFPWQQAGETGMGVLDTSATGYVRFGHDTEFDLTGDFTIEVRASFEHFDGHQEIISKNSAWDRDGFVFKWHDRRLEFIRGGPGGEIGTDSGAYTVAGVALANLEPGRMYELAVIKNGSMVEFLVDGKVVGAGRIGSLVATSAVMMMSTPWTEGYLAGQVDELRIWRHARSTKMMATNTRRQFEGDEPHLVALYRFDSLEDGQTIRNASNPALHGALIGQAALIATGIRPAMRTKR